MNATDGIKQVEASEQTTSVQINKYMYFDGESGKYYMTEDGLILMYPKKNVISSYSGCHEWIHHFTLEMINVYSGSSPFNHCLDSIDHHIAFGDVFNSCPRDLIEWVKESVDSEWGRKMYKCIEHIIEDLPKY